jgi:NADH-quinone oxidoreductase subunit L
MTCFYMFRLFFKTFHGKPRNEHAFEHAHESPLTMTIPLCVLALLSVVSAGNQFIGDSHLWFEQRVASDVLVPLAAGQAPDITHETEVFKEAHHGVLITSVSLFVLGLAASALFFSPFAKLDSTKLIAIGPMRWLHRSLVNLWYVDRVLVGVALWILHKLRKLCGIFDMSYIDGFVNLWGTICRFVTSVVGTVDYHGVDGAVRGLGEGTLRGGRTMRRMQTGVLQVYIYASMLIFAGVLILSVFLIWSRIG